MKRGQHKSVREKIGGEKQEQTGVGECGERILSSLASNVCLEISHLVGNHLQQYNSFTAL
jgi:hypothetical protein